MYTVFDTFFMFGTTWKSCLKLCKLSWPIYLYNEYLWALFYVSFFGILHKLTQMYKLKISCNDSILRCSWTHRNSVCFLPRYIYTSLGIATLDLLFIQWQCLPSLAITVAFSWTYNTENEACIIIKWYSSVYSCSVWRSMSLSDRLQRKPIWFNSMIEYLHFMKGSIL